MHVVAALHRQRQVVAEPLRHHVRPGAERHHDGTGFHRSVLGLDAPAGGGLLQGLGVACRQLAAEALEQAHIAHGELMRV